MHEIEQYGGEQLTPKYVPPKVLQSMHKFILHLIDPKYTNYSVECWYTCSHWVEKKEKFSHSCANIEGIEGLLQTFQLRQSWYELKNIVLQIL